MQSKILLLNKRAVEFAMKTAISKGNTKFESLVSSSSMTTVENVHPVTPANMVADPTIKVGKPGTAWRFKPATNKKL